MKTEKTGISGYFRKDVSDHVKCNVSECTPKDVFLSETYGNQSHYKVIGKLIDGRIEAKSISGEKIIKLLPNSMVYRKKRLHESTALNECDLTAFGLLQGEASTPEVEAEKPQSTRLVDNVNLSGGMDLISLLY